MPTSKVADLCKILKPLKNVELGFMFQKRIFAHERGIGVFVASPVDVGEVVLEFDVNALLKYSKTLKKEEEIQVTVQEESILFVEESGMSFTLDVWESEFPEEFKDLLKDTMSVETKKFSEGDIESLLASASICSPKNISTSFVYINKGVFAFDNDICFRSNPVFEVEEPFALLGSAVKDIFSLPISSYGLTFSHVILSVSDGSAMFLLEKYLPEMPPFQDLFKKPNSQKINLPPDLIEDMKRITKMDKTTRANLDIQKDKVILSTTGKLKMKKEYEADVGVEDKYSVSLFAITKVLKYDVFTILDVGQHLSFTCKGFQFVINKGS